MIMLWSECAPPGAPADADAGAGAELHDGCACLCSVEVLFQP